MKSWRMKDIVVMAALAVVFGIVYLLFLPVNVVMMGLVGPIGTDIIFGVWFLVSIVAAYIIQKPGVALVSETIAGIVEVLIGSSVGPIVILSAVVQGLGAEAAFAMTRYRSYHVLVLMGAGVGAAITSFIWGYFRGGFVALDPSYVVLMLVVRIISGAVISGLIGKAISEALAKTGTLTSFPLGKTYRQRKAG
ncbi:ECF transporter S component [Terribacillus sp. 179-K 1B1 HS]|uniref:ECF transporter S component n=1 Tax=Terribacillus sp. 179-K 1B1 HS TaxID=3142388 RepID=UPI0039A0A327